MNANSEARPRTRRRWPLWLGGGILLVLAALIGCEIAGWPFLRGPLQRQMEKKLGVPVVLDGDFRLHLLRRPELRAAHLNIGAAHGLQVPHLLDATDVRLGWRWRDAWRFSEGGPLRIELLQANGLDVNLLRAADGRATWQVGAQDKPPATKPSDNPNLPSFGTLAVGNGHLMVDDRVIDTKAEIKVRGQEGSNGGVQGYEASAVGNYQKAPLRITLKSGGALPLLSDSADAPAVPIRAEGKVGGADVLFDGRAAALMASQRFDGTLRIAGPSLAAVAEPFGVTLPRTPAFELVGKLAHDGTVYHLVVDRATIGSSRLNGDFRYDSANKPTLLTGRLGGPRLLLTDLGPAVGTGGEGKPSAEVAADAQSKGKVLPSREFDLPSLRAMNANVDVAIDELDFGSNGLAPVKDLKTKITLDGGVLTLNALQARMAEARFAGMTQLDGRGDPAKWALKLKVSNLDIAGWLKAVRKPGAVTDANNAKALKAQRDAAVAGGGRDTPVTAYLTGLLGADIDITGRGRSTAQIVGTLDGRADLAIRDGSISHLVTEALGLDIAQALGVLVKGDDTLALRCGRFDTALKNGVVVPRVAVISSADSTTRIDGEVNLRDETLKMRAVTRPHDISPLTLRTPITVSGTLADPSVGIEARKLAGRAVAAAALAVVAAPVAAVIPFIDLGSKDKTDPCADGPK